MLGIHLGFPQKESTVMPKIERSAGLSWRKHTSKKELTIWLYWLIGLSVVTYAWHLISEKTIWFFVQDAGTQAMDIGSRMVPPKFTYMDKLWGPVWDTINIATLGTVIALIIAVPVAFSAAKNTTPHPIIRTIALFILVFICGPGIFAGTIAIGLRSIGFCAKLLYEAIEEIDHNQVEAIQATGASRAQQMLYGIVPQVLPTFAGVGVYRWDINIRESTILGLVGAGGIGLQLNGSINTLAWTQVSMILLVILATVIISEWISAKVRHAII